jgi:hypothetical protein
MRRKGHTWGPPVVHNDLQAIDHLCVIFWMLVMHIVALLHALKPTIVMH